MRNKSAIAATIVDAVEAFNAAHNAARYAEQILRDERRTLTDALDRAELAFADDSKARFLASHTRRELERASATSLRSPLSECNAHQIQELILGETP